MSNQQLSDYIKNQTEKGKSKEEIKNSLLNAGWKENDVNEALGIFDQAPPPPPSTPFSSTGLKQLDPKATWVFFFSSVMSVIVGLFFLFLWLGPVLSAAEIGVPTISLIFILVLLLLSYIWAKLAYKYYRYELAEEDFRKEYGVIAKKYTTIPYERIQNINVQRGIIDRILGLSSLKIFTAGTGGSGSAGAEGLLPGLSEKVAEELRDELSRRARKGKGRGL